MSSRRQQARIISILSGAGRDPYAARQAWMVRKGYLPADQKTLADIRTGK